MNRHFGEICRHKKQYPSIFRNHKIKKKKVKMSSSSHNSSRFPFQKSDEEWKNILSAEQYRVLRQKGTERAGTGEYDKKVSPLKKKKRKMQVERGQKEKKILISGQNKFLSTTVSLCLSVSVSLSLF